ncbi:MAG: hypothetical protein ACT4N2_09330 [Hyphomicrobium sp.]
MITIQSAMLVLLGFFTAALVCFLVAPLYRRRAARMATDELKRSMPLTTAEIRADKDRLRAEFAITIHKLEAKLEQADFGAARQLVEINRRDAAISGLEGEVARMRTFLDEHENARRVLEQTITERLPKVEHRLAEAKKMLGLRDREIADLARMTSKQVQALDEARQINAQQRDELHRLNATLTTHAARNRESLRDPRFDAEVALRAEIEALRGKARDQSALIGRLQGVLGKSGADRASIPGLANGADATAGDEHELKRLSKDLAEAEMALRSVKGAAEAGQAEHAHFEQELRALKATNRDQSTEIANLKAALKAYEIGSADDRAIKESKIALKARLSALQAQADEQTSTIQTLRAEIAAANEKLARQASHYMDEMRRLGAGTVPVTGPSRRPLIEPAKRASLSERIAAPRPPKPTAEPAAGPPPLPAPDVQAAETAASAASAASIASGMSAAGVLAANGQGNGSGAYLRAIEGSGASTPAAAAAAEADKQDLEGAGNAPKARRPGLLERITGLEKPA